VKALAQRRHQFVQAMILVFCRSMLGATDACVFISIVQPGRIWC